MLALEEAAWAWIPPPKLAELSETVLLVRVRELVPEEAWVEIPPPAKAELPATVLLTSVTVPPSAKIPPPRSSGALPPLAIPPRIVVSLTVKFPAALTARMRKLGAPPLRRIVLPSPSMVISLVITGNPVGP
jgi:hypothetical protein